MSRFGPGAVVRHPERGVGVVRPIATDPPLVGRVRVDFDELDRALFCWEDDVARIFADVDGVEATAITDGGRR